MAPWRGESTEITTWDNDGYLSGERFSVKRPKDAYFDEVGFTMAYFGDLTTANFFLRSNRLLDEPNFFQYYASKRINTHVSASGDYTRQAGVPFVHAAVTMKVPAVVVDQVRYEQYFRYGTKGGSGFAVYGEKNVTKTFSAGFGYATIDQVLPDGQCGPVRSREPDLPDVELQAVAGVHLLGVRDAGGRHRLRDREHVPVRCRRELQRARELSAGRLLQVGRRPDLSCVLSDRVAAGRPARSFSSATGDTCHPRRLTSRTGPGRRAAP